VVVDNGQAMGHEVSLLLKQDCTRGDAASSNVIFHIAA